MSSLAGSIPATLDRFLGSGGRPHVGAGAVLNVLSVSLAIAGLTGLADPELMIDGLWLTLAVGAFVFSVGFALVRIAIGSIVILVMMAVEASADGIPMQIELADLTEWPLLLAISVIVTLMAHRMSTMAKRYAALYRQTSDRLVSAQEVERGRLSQDLHDSVGQTLTAVLLSLDSAEGALRNVTGPTATVRSDIRRAHDLTADALDETRDVAAQLRPPRIAEVGLGAAVRDLAANAGLPVEVRFDPGILPPGLLPGGQEIGVYRVVQEAVGNAARHSHAGHIWIDAGVTDRTIRLEVGDDGIGFDVWSPRVRGMGLAGMQERAGVLNGQLFIHSDARSGTRVTLVVPRVPRPAGRVVTAQAPEAGH